MKWSEVAQSCPILWDPMDCSLSGSSVHGISQERKMDWAPISFSRSSSRSKDRTHVSCISSNWRADSLPLEPPGKPLYILIPNINMYITHSHMHSHTQKCNFPLLKFTCGVSFRLVSLRMQKVNPKIPFFLPNLVYEKWHSNNNNLQN